jgi:hypothetical protein
LSQQIFNNTPGIKEKYMSPLIQETLEELYRFIIILADNRLSSWLIVSNKYEYNYNILAPLAMTDVPPSRIPKIPALPTKDELPSEKWVSLVLTQLSLLAKKKPLTP